MMTRRSHGQLWTLSRSGRPVHARRPRCPQVQCRSAAVPESSKLLCKLAAGGMAHQLEITHELVGSADFREVQKQAPSASGLGKPPYRIKVKGTEVLKNGAAELVQAILEEGKQG